MKKKPTIELSVKDLRLALTGLSKVISRKSTLPALGCVRIESDPANFKKVLLIGTDLDTWITLNITGNYINTHKPCSLLIPLTDLKEAVKGGEVKDWLSVQQENNGHASLFRHIGTGIVTRSAECGNLSDYPEQPDIKEEPFALDTHAQEALQQSMRCCSSDPARQVLHGALLEEGKTFVGTDGRHLYCCNSMALPVKNSVILAQHKIMDWAYLRNSTDWKLTISKDWFRLRGEDWQVTSRLVEGNYPNWQQVMPQEKEYRSSVELAAVDLDQVCTTITSMPGEKQSSKPVGLRLTRDTCSLLAKGDDDGASSEVSVPNAKTKGPGVSVFLNRDYFTKALGFGLNHIDIIDEKSPVRFRSSEADGRDMIVMPVRVFDSSPAEPPSPKPQPKPERKSTRMKNTSSSNGGNSRQPQTDPTPSPLDEACAHINEVKDLLRQATSALNESVSSLKQMKAEQKTAEREIRQVRNTIRSLQKVEL